MSSNFSNDFERILIQCVDLDEKNNKELGDLLNFFDLYINQYGKTISLSIVKEIKSVVKCIERLILKDIEQIDDEELFIERIYNNLESINKLLEKRERAVEDGTLDSDDLELSDNYDPVDEAFQEKTPVEKRSEPVEVIQDDKLSEQDDDVFLDFIQEIKEYIDTLEDEIINLEKNPTDKNIINEIFRPFHTLKGVSGFMGLKKLNRISHETETLLDYARNGKIEINQPIIDAVLLVIDAIKAMISSLDAKNRFENIDEAKFEGLLNLVNSLSVDRSSSVLKKSIEEEKTVSSEDLTSLEIDKTPVDKKIKDTSIKIKTEKLDTLIDMVGEIVIMHNVLKEDRNILKIRDHDFLKKFSQFSRTVGELQKSSTSLRMIPIAATFQKMKRVVRDYSKKNKKPINLHFKGEDTEIDRNIVDSLYDPLVHMVRNSCDHGIEKSSLRRDRDKPETGNITLNAYHKGNSFILDIIDDGNGLDKERIYKKALERKLVDKDKIFTDSEIYKFVMEPGFSTATTITDVSGRGVGLDVVNQGIKNLGGRIEIETEHTVGTTFRMVVPLTLAIIEGMLVKSGSEMYIIPILNVIRSLKPERENINYIMGKGETIKVDDSLIPVVRLYKVFKIGDAVEDINDSLLILITDQKRRYALQVDKLIGIQDVVVKSLGRKFRDLKGVSGATILGDGQVGLILDINNLVGENYD